MSRYNKSHGRGKSHGGAGLKFDTLLKACSNSKKPSANKTAGALGRFGIASFTSTRNVTLENSGEEESRFKFFNKRAKLSEPTSGNNSLSGSYHVNNSQNVQQSPYGVVPVVPPAPVYKPRKFFKSRDPLAASDETSKEANNSVTSPPVRSAEVIAPIKIPVPKVRDRVKYESPEKNSSKPLRNANNASPPQPIKLRIFKDKATSKLVSVSEAPPPLEVAHEKAKPEKMTKKRGRKPKNVPESPSPVKFVEPSPPPAREKKSGRLTRNSRKHVDGNAQEPCSDSVDPALAFHPMNQMGAGTFGGVSGGNPYQSNNLYSSGSALDSRRTNCDPSAFPNTNIEKKLEEDVEFQQLSQMLSSMEEEGAGDYNSLGYHQSSHNHQEAYVQLQQQQMHVPTMQQTPETHQHHSLSQQSHVHQYVQEPHVHPPPMQYNHSQPFASYPPDPISAMSSLQVSHQPVTSNSLTNNNMIVNPTVSPVVAAPPKVRDAQDIRAILEDDWDESFEDESPKKSPPKTSRFDLSAFMHDGSQGVPDASPNQSFEAGPSPTMNRYTVPIQEPVAVPGAGAGTFAHQYHHHHHSQQPLPSSQPHLNYPNQYVESSQQPPLAAPFNAPYAVRNLLSSTKEFQSETQANTTNYSQEAEVSSHFSSTAAVAKDEMSDVKGHVDAEKPLALNLSVNPAQLPQVTPAVSQANSQSHSSGATKKGSIFKSRALAQTAGDAGEKGTQGNPKKRLALYKHKFGQGDGDDESKTKQGAVAPAGKTYQDEFDEGSDSEDVGSLRRVTASETTTKNLYSVIRNVKPIHELQESGEFHEFDGDVWYILDELKDKNPITNRCLSAITLATRCMEPAFRMHLRAHGTVGEFCKELQDAPTNPILALLASTVLFVLSQDRLNMDLDTDSLKLIIALSKTGEATNIADDSPEITKLRQRVIDLVSEMKSRGHAKHLKNITASELALETLLYLTSKRAGDFLKHELRTLGGLDYIVTEVVASLDWLRYEVSTIGFSEVVIDRLWKIDRCLRVVQQVTFNHEDNQRYLLGVSDEKLGEIRLQGSPEIFISIFRFCDEQLSSLQRDSEPAKVLHEILFSVLRVLENLSHDYRGIVLGSEILCAMDGFLPLCLHSVFHISVNIPDDKVFDLLMHSLCMLLNLVELSKNNRNAILCSTVRRSPAVESSWSSDDSGVEEEQPTLDALVQMFISKERAAKEEEASTDDILTKGSDSKKPAQKNASGSQNAKDSKDSQESESSNSVQDTIDKLIQTAGKHMENSLIAAYISLLLAYLIMDNPAAAETVRNFMPNQRYLPLMVVLKKLFNFMSITSSASGSLRGLKATAIALKFYAKCDPQSNEELKKIIPD